MPTSCTCKLQTLDICLTFGTTTDHLQQLCLAATYTGHLRKGAAAAVPGIGEETKGIMKLT